MTFYMIVNGKHKFKLYTPDTNATIVKRLASNMRSIPKYMYFPKGKDFPSGKTTVRNLLTRIGNDNKESFKHIFDELKKEYKSIRVSTSELYKIWLSYNKVFDDLEEDDEKVSAAREEAEKLLQISSKQFNTYFRERKKFRSNVNKEIQRNKESVIKDLKSFKDFSGKGKIDAKITNIDITTVNNSVDLITPEGITLMEIFNSIRLYSKVPFATSNNFFKILKTFDISREWAESVEKQILVKVLESEHTVLPEVYNDILVEKKEGKFNMAVDLKKGKKTVDLKEIEKRFLRIFSPSRVKVQIDDSSRVETKMKGFFYILDWEFKQYVLQDLIMNDNRFSDLMYINEFQKATKTVRGLYIKFSSPISGNVSSDISVRVVEKGDYLNKDEQYNVPIGTKYVRIRFDARNKQAVEFFMDTLSRLFKIYEDVEEDVIKEYQLYIPKFGMIDETKSGPELKRVEHSDLLEVSNYSRACRKNRMPSIIPRDVVKRIGLDEIEEEYVNVDIDGEKRLVAKFPKSGEEGDKLWYVCDKSKDYPYIGLRYNPLSNKNKYPYMLCCYQNPNERNGLPDHYYFDKPLRKQIKTKGLAEYGKANIIEKDSALGKFIDLLDPEAPFYRTGSDRNVNSFLECIIKGLGRKHIEEYGFDYIVSMKDKDEREVNLTQTRESLSTHSYLCKQSMYDSTVDDIKNYIESESYLDPRNTLDLMENLFGCYIYVFTGEIDDMSLLIPNYKKSYLRMERGELPSIMIFENMTPDGYPQCELIIRKNVRNDKFAYRFSSSNDISRKLSKVFNDMTNFVILDRPLNPIRFPDNLFGDDIIGVGFDVYGKIRKIKLKNNLVVDVDPLPPVMLSEEPEILTESSLISLKDALELTKLPDSNFDNPRLVVSNKKFIRLDGDVGSIVGYINIIPEKIGNVDLPVVESKDSIPQGNNSLLNNYNWLKRLTRYIVEYMFWLYSKFIDDEGMDMDDNSISKFFDKYVKIKPSFKYKMVSKKFVENSGVMEGGRIVVHDVETSKKLAYVLRMEILRNRFELVEYKDRENIKNYYVDISDLTPYEDQLILYGYDSVEKWVLEKQFEFHLKNHVIIGLTRPYFFQNDIISKQMFLAQNIDSLNKAIDVGYTWKKRGYNIGIHAGGKSVSTGFTLFNYESNVNIQKMGEYGNPKNHDIYILGYKITDEPMYTVLLPLM